MHRLSSKNIAAIRFSAFVLVAVLSFPVAAASPTANAQRLQPSPLLAIDQNRATVVDRILREWGDSLQRSNAGITGGELRELLMGLRADHLLAASLAANIDGLRNVLANALTSTPQLSRSLPRAKAMGDISDDLVYTPVTPCRVVDSRLAGGTLPAGSTRNWLATNPGGDFAAQGGSNSNCGIPVKPAAVLVNITAANTGGGPAYLLAWTYNQAQPLASTLNWTAANSTVANTAIVQLCTGACADDFSVYVSSSSDVIVDVAGYFAAPTNYGVRNVITGLYATVGAGSDNTASGDYSAVGGGAGNTASDEFSTVAGGVANSARGEASTVAGGEGNTAVGEYSTVAGGYNSVARGKASFASGWYANPLRDGCFVWSDMSSDKTTTCFVPNAFVSRSMGGYYFFTAGTSDSDYTGAALASGSGAWATYSDRDGKTNVKRVDPLAVLQKLVSMPIATWNWKAQDARIRHMGPMAQDFSAAFGLGEDDKHISTVDSDGVALAAIQGLHHVIKEKNREIVRLKARTDLMERKLQAIEAKLGSN